LNQWNNIYINEGKDYKYYDILKPHPELPKVSEIFKNQNVCRVLDFGCGAGRNSIYLLKQGFEIFGIDNSVEGIKIFTEILNDLNLEANLRISDIFDKLPFKGEFFDAIISVQVLQHGLLDQILYAIAEVERILKPNGLIFITLCGRYSKGKVRQYLIQTAKQIAPRTYLPTKGNEKNLPHYIYNVKILKNHYRNFRILKLWKDNLDYFCFLGVKRNPLF